MTPNEILEKLGHGNVILIAEDELDALLKDAKLLRQGNTFVNGFIRVLEYRGSIIIQEYTDKKEAVLRRGESIEAADRFVDDRLVVYEKMWDGCGCKIDYYN